MNIEQIKKDLRELHGIQVSIKTLLEAEERLRRQVIYLQQFQGFDNEIRQAKKEIEKLNTTDYISRATNIYKTYTDIFTKLKPLYRTIATAIFLNGDTHRQVADRLGYSIHTIRTRHLPAIYEQIKILINKKSPN